MSEKYILPTQEAGQQFFQKYHNKGKVVMLNLLKFRAVADYSKSETLKPAQEITGQEAYQLYSQFTIPILEKVKSKVLYFGSSAGYLIGPEAEKWDAVILVEHQSAQDFIAFSQNEEYLKTAGHRTAALEDSRLLPMVTRML